MGMTTGKHLVRFVLQAAVCYVLWLAVDGLLVWILERFAGMPFPARFYGDPPTRYLVVDTVALVIAVSLQTRWRWPDWPKS